MVLSPEESLFCANSSKSPLRSKNLICSKRRRLQKDICKRLCLSSRFLPDLRSRAPRVNTHRLKTRLSLRVAQASASARTSLKCLRASPSSSLISLPSCSATPDKSCLKMVCSTKTVQRSKASRSRSRIFEQSERRAVGVFKRRNQSREVSNKKDLVCKKSLPSCWFKFSQNNQEYANLGNQ